MSSGSKTPGGRIRFECKSLYMLIWSQLLIIHDTQSKSELRLRGVVCHVCVSFLSPFLDFFFEFVYLYGHSAISWTDMYNSSEWNYKLLCVCVILVLLKQKDLSSFLHHQIQITDEQMSLFLTGISFNAGGSDKMQGGPQNHLLYSTSNYTTKRSDIPTCSSSYLCKYMKLCVSV